MNKLRTLLESRSAIIVDMEELTKKADAEKRDFTEQEQETFDRLAGDAEKMARNIENEKKIEELRASTKGDSRSNERAPERVTPPAATGTTTEEKRSGFGSFGEMLRAVVSAETPGNYRADPRLIETRAASGLNEGVGSEGGFLVDKQLINDLLVRTHETGKIYRDVSRLQVGPGKNGVSMNILDETSRVNGQRLGGINVFWTAEAGLKQASRPAFARKELVLQKIAALLYTTDELLEDAVALESLVRQLFPQEMSYAIDDAILRGDGVGKPQGIFESPALIAVDRVTNGTITFDDVLNMYSRFSGENGVWYINRNIMPALAKMTMATGASSGVPVWMPANGAVGQQNSTLFGLPVVPVEQASTLGTKGDISLIDPKQYLVIEKGGLKTDVSMHVRYIYDESVFRFVLRLNGMPIWSSALTPAYGTASSSPYVTLDT